MNKAIAGCLVLSILVAAYAQEPPDQVREYIERGETRMLYMNSSELPIEQSFAAFSGLITAMENMEEVRGAGAHHIVENTGMSEVVAANLTARLLAAHVEIKELGYQRGHEAACDGDTARGFGDAAYDAIEAMEDAEDAAAIDVYHRTLATLSSDDAAAFILLLEANKLSMGMVRIDRRKSYARTGRSIDDTLAKLCRNRGPEE